MQEDAGERVDEETVSPDESVSDDSGKTLIRGAQAIADYLNSKIAGGPPISRAAVYRMAEDGKIKVFRLGAKKSEIWSTTGHLDKVISSAMGLRESEAA